MGFADYSELQAAILDTLDRAELTTAVKDWIRLAEIDAQRELGLRTVEKRVSDTLTADVDRLEWPADLLAPRMLRLDLSPIRVLELVTLERLAHFRENAQGDGIPRAAAPHGLGWDLAPVPSAAHPYTLWYEASGLIYLSDGEPTNWLLLQAPDVLFYGALVHSAPYVGQDRRLSTWEGFYARARLGLRVAESRARWSGGGPLRTRPDVVGG